jgi:hypothetical protein
VSGERPPARHRIQVGISRAFGVVGVVGISAALAAILAHNNVDGWIIGLVVSVLSLILGALIIRAAPPS